MAEMVEGADQLRALALELRAAGQVEMMRDLRFALATAAQPAERVVRASALANLPHEGGLNQWIAGADFRTSMTTGPRTAGVSLRISKRGGSKGKHDMPAFDDGTFRHPVFARPGNPKKKWVPESITPGFASKPIEALLPEITAAVLAAMDEVTVAAGFH